MGKKEINQEILNKLEGFFVNSIADKLFDGVTYVLIKDTDEQLINIYKNLRKELDEEGYAPTELFRVYRANNGYIFDLDLSICLYYTEKILTEQKTENVKEIISKLRQTRKDNIYRLAKYIKAQVEGGKDTLEVGIYSTNPTPRIVFTVDTKDGKTILVQYQAFNLRHWDLDSVNESLLGEGVRISKIEPCEILPYKNGLRMILHTESVI